MANEKILVVDDETNLRRVLSAQLVRDGYDVHTAEDGEEALAFLRRYRSLIVEAAVPDVTIEGGSLLMTQVLPPRLTWQRGPAEAQAAGALTQLRVLAGEGICPTLVELPHAMRRGPVPIRLPFITTTKKSRFPAPTNSLQL